MTLAATTAGCSEHYQSPASIVAETYKGGTGLDFADCGESSACDEGSNQCLLDAFESCTPSERRALDSIQLVHPTETGTCVAILFWERHEKECEWDCASTTVVEEYRCTRPQAECAFHTDECDLLGAYEFWH